MLKNIDVWVILGQKTLLHDMMTSIVNMYNKIGN